VHCLAGSRGAELHPGLETAPLSLIVRKGTRQELDSYSAFFENDRRTPTGLGGCLRELDCGQVYLCGLATDVCVYYTALDALALGFTVGLVRDACRGIDVPAGSLRERLRELSDGGVRILDSSEVP
jgi:nicotinamidase/pyrazinamidase